MPGLCPHTARRSTHLLQKFSLEEFNHPPYSPDLEPSDFHIFLNVWKFLSGQCQRFQNEREAEMSVTAKHCRNCDGLFRTNYVGCLVPMLSCCTIMLGHTRLEGQHITFRSSAGMCLIIHPIVRISRPVVSIFSCTSRNSCPV